MPLPNQRQLKDNPGCASPPGTSSSPPPFSLITVERFLCPTAGRAECVNPKLSGTKVGAHYRLSIESGARAEINLRLSDQKKKDAFKTFNKEFDLRASEADSFYRQAQAEMLNKDIARSED